MKRVFLDTNILLDFGLGRKGAEEAEKILALGLAGVIEVCASYLSYANMGFILRHHSKEEIYDLVSQMREDVLVLPTDATQLDNSLTLLPMTLRTLYNTNAPKPMVAMLLSRTMGKTTPSFVTYPT